MRGRPPRWDGDRNPSLITLMDLFNQPIPDLPGVPREMIQLLRYGMANDPASRPTAEQLRDLLTKIDLDKTGPIVPPPRWTPGDDTPTVRAQFKPHKKKWLFGLLGIQDR
jgi:hypothetical protein